MKYISIACLAVLILISSVSCTVGTHADPKNSLEEEVEEVTNKDIDSGLIIFSAR